MKKNITVQVGDGRTAVVDEARFTAFDSLRSNPMFAAAIAESGEFMGRDAGEALAFIVSQLAYTESQVFETMGYLMQYRELLAGCITSEAGEWADTIRYEIFDLVGRGKRISGKGHDINEVDVAYTDASMPVHQGGVGYSYTTEELRRTAFLRRPIPELKLRAAMEAYERHMNDIGLYGETDLTGLFNNPNATQGNAPNGGWIAGYAGAPSTYPAKIIQDIQNGFYTVWSQTAFNDMPNMCAMPPALYNFLKTTYATEAGFFNKTLLSLIEEANLNEGIGPKPKFFPAITLDTAGSGATNRLVFYVRSPDRLIMHLPMPLRFLAPQLLGLDVRIPGEYKYSGVALRYPKTMYYQDGE